MDAIEDKKMKAYLDEIIEVSKKHGLSLGHEDIGGNFLIQPFKSYNIKWLREAKSKLIDNYS